MSDAMSHVHDPVGEPDFVLTCVRDALRLRVTARYAVGPAVHLEHTFRAHAVRGMAADDLANMLRAAMLNAADDQPNADIGEPLVLALHRVDWARVAAAARETAQVPS